MLHSIDNSTTIYEGVARRRSKPHTATGLRSYSWGKHISIPAKFYRKR